MMLRNTNGTEIKKKLKREKKNVCIRATFYPIETYLTYFLPLFECFGINLVAALWLLVVLQNPVHRYLNPIPLQQETEKKTTIIATIYHRYLV